MALLAVMDGELIGCGSYECDDAPRSLSAEIAFTVPDDMHNRGVGMLLMEHLISLARSRGLHAFTAETLSENAAMLRVFADAGLQAHRALADGVYDLTFPLPAGEEDVTLGTYRDAVAERERSADVASLRHVLAPASVAVIGAAGRLGRAGHPAQHRDRRLPGPVYAVNPAAAELDGVPCLPSAAACPRASTWRSSPRRPRRYPALPGNAGSAGSRGWWCSRRDSTARPARSCWASAGATACGWSGRPARRGQRRAGLDATFAARHPKPGSAGLALQSTGGAGFALAEHLSRIGVGISSLVSLGDKDDVAGDDMLLWWESDPATKLALLYLESIANPPKFARTARRVGRSMPVLTVIVGRSVTGRRLAGARAAAATPLLTRQALFEQAGVIAVANLGELLDTAVLLAAQPAPAGNRVAVVSNTRGAAVLAADACGDAGLQVARLAGDTQRALRDLLSRDATVTGPVDTTLLIGPGRFRRCLELAGADPGVDAVLALTTTSAGSDPVPEVSAARLPVPIAAAVLDQVEVVRLLRAPGADSPAVPAYAYAESAARALGHAARYGMWRAIPPGTVPDLDGLRPDRARELVAEFLAGSRPAAGCRWTRPRNCSPATGYRWPTASGSSPRTPPSRRQPGSAARSRSGRTCPAWSARVAPAPC